MTDLRTVLIIPARYESSRLPGKPLTPISGVPMIERTYKQCVRGFPREDIYVATDDERIADFCAEKDMQCLMTSKECLTGTDRVAEAAEMLQPDYVINVQGDEPIFNPDDIRAFLDAVRHHPREVLNGYTPIHREENYRSRGVPKVVFRPDGRLLYMSRSPIPGNKSDRFERAFRQVCIYGFPFELLRAFASQKTKGRLEAIEDIEILRFLEMGHEVRMIELSDVSVAVDYPEDVQKVEAVLSRK